MIIKGGLNRVSELDDGAHKQIHTFSDVTYTSRDSHPKYNFTERSSF